jgi:hypothetical protein
MRVKEKPPAVPAAKLVAVPATAKWGTANSVPRWGKLAEKSYFAKNVGKK